MDVLIQQVREDMNRLRGRLFELVEAVNFPEPQAHAIKGAIRHVTYDAQRSVESTLRSLEMDK